MFSGGMKRKFDDLSEESNGNNSTKGEGENENGKNSSSSSEFPANAWEQFTLGRNRYNQQIVICKKCGFDQTYSSLKDAIIQHLSKNCKEKIISIATKNEPVVLETKQDPIESPKVNEIIEIDLTSVASPVLPVITHATYYEELNEKLHNLQRFDVAKESRLQIPAQFRLKKVTLEERARYNTNNNKMVRESSEYQSSNGNGSHADIDSVSSTTVGSSKHISNQLDRQYTFTSPWYSYVKSNISGCLASLKVLEMERNNLIVQENYSHALETWKWRQSLLLKRNENREFNIQSTRSYFQMPLVSRFSNSSIQKKVKVLDNDEEDEDMDTEDDREEVEEKKEKEKPIFAKSYVIRQLLPKCKGASYTKNASVKIIVDKKAFRCLQRINSICTNHNVVVSRKARFNTSFPKVSRNPASCFFIKIRENQVMEDQTTFRSLPYLGDDVRIDISEFNRIVGHVPGQIEPEVCGEAEELLVAYFISQGIVRSSSKSINFEQVHEKNVLPEILAALTSVLEVSTKEILRAYKVISESYWFRHGISENSSKSKVNSWAAIDLDKVGYCEPLLALTGFDEASFDIDDEHNLQTGVGIGLGVINSLRYNKMVANFRDFFCRRCYIMNCYDHSIQQPQPQKRIDPNPPFSSVFNKLLLPSDFIRFHRRSYFNSNRYLIENFPSIAEMERGNQTENMRPSLRSQETFINKLEYDSRSRTIKIKESKSSAGGIQTRTATLMKDMELFDWIESEEDWVDIRDLCRPCTPSLQGSSLDVKPRKMKKGHSPRHDSGLDDFQPIFKSTLDVRKVTPSITNVDHPILSNLDLSNMVEEKENPNPRSQKLKTSIDWSIDSTTNIPSTSSNAPYLSDDEVVLFINKAPRSNQAASAVQIIPGSSTDKSIIEVVSIPETTTTIDSSSVSESNQIRNRKYDFQQSFTPPLTDAELALIEKLCSVHKTLKPFMTPFDQRLPFEQYFQPKLMENHGGNVSNFAVNRMLNYETKQADKVPLVKFIAEVMQTRQTSEIVRIIQERDWLFLNLMNGDHNGSSDFSRNGITDSAISDTMMETEIEKMEFEFFPGADEEDDELVIFSVNHNKLNINTKNHSYQACGHLGPCTNDNKNCICVVYGNFCDKYCCCDRQCRRKFQGCNCQRGQCKTKACPCWAAGRACDPDLCGTCGVSLHPIYLKLLQSKLPSKPASENLNEKVASKSFNSNSVMKKLNSRDKLANFIDLSTDDLQEKASLDSKVLNTVKDIKQNLSNPSPIMNLDLDQSVTLKICNNLPFNLRTPKKICIKPSTIHGWGAFALEPIEKNEFVIEYRGELISQEEADRRGIIYDKLNLSYLFNINEETVIDATKKGNKAKFLNHSENPNCATRVLQMFGDHKVGIFAKRDINIGEELTFDYLYRKCVPTWAEKKTTTTNVSKNRKNSKSKSSSK